MRVSRAGDVRLLESGLTRFRIAEIEATVDDDPMRIVDVCGKCGDWNERSVHTEAGDSG